MQKKQFLKGETTPLLPILPLLEELTASFNEIVFPPAPFTFPIFFTSPNASNSAIGTFLPSNSKNDLLPVFFSSVPAVIILSFSALINGIVDCPFGALVSIKVLEEDNPANFFCFLETPTANSKEVGVILVTLGLNVSVNLNENNFLSSPAILKNCGETFGA